jgi:uncharacterized membrane protein YgcG
LADDEDIEQDSEAYRKWRSGNDNDKYASSKTPSETGSKSGTYSIPKADDEYALPGEEDNSGGGSWLDGDMNWPLIIAAIVIFALISSTIVAFMLSSSESDSKPSEWPETEGIIVKQYDVNTIITEEYCEDQNDDGYLDDWECWKDFVYQIGLVYNYTLDSGNYTLNEYIEFWESEWVDDIKRDGEEELFQKFINETDERIALNSTVKITYNPDAPNDAYSEFMNSPDDPLGFVGYFFMCCGGMLCVPLIIGGVIMSWAKNASGMNGGYGRNRWGPFGGFGYNNHSGGRNHRTTRRSGGTSRSGGGGRSGSRGGGGRSGGGGRRR